MKKFLVGVDGSSASEHAARVTAEHAVRVGSTVVLAHVRVPAMLPAGAAAVLPQLEEADRQESQQLLQRLGRAIADTGASIELRELAGDSAANALADLAATDEFDLVAVGSQGRGAVARMFLGSVADRLVHISSKPVLVVR